MQPLRRLLAATDFSTSAAHAAARAARIGAAQGAALELLHVLPSPVLASLREIFLLTERNESGLVADAQQRLEALANELRAEHRLEIAASVCVGIVRDAVLAAAATADLLVVGPRGANPLRDMILGTTAERLLNAAPCPILVVKRPPQEDYRRVLVAVDFSPFSAAALAAAERLAPGAELHLCHALDLPFEGKLWLAGVDDAQINRYRAHARQRASEEMTQLVTASGIAPARIVRHLEHGDPGPVLLTREIGDAADLIVIGKHGQTFAQELFLGSVTRHLLSDSRADVLVVPPAAA